MAGPRVYIFVQAYTPTASRRRSAGKRSRTCSIRAGRTDRDRSEEQEWFFTLVREMGGEEGLKFFRTWSRPTA